MDDENNNTSNTQGADDQMPASSAPDMNGDSGMGGGMPTPNNGEGEQSNGDNLPAGGEEDENDNDEDMNNQSEGANFDDHQ